MDEEIKAKDPETMQSPGESEVEYKNDEIQEHSELKKKINRKKVIIIASTVFLILAGLAVAAYSYYYPKKEEIVETSKVEEEVNLITWQEPEKITTLNLYKETTGSENDMGGIVTAAEREKTSAYYKVGTVNSGQYIDGEVLLAYIDSYSAHADNMLIKFVRKEDKLYLLSKYSPEFDLVTEGIDSTKYTVDETFNIKELNLPETITDSANEETFIRDKSVTLMFDGTNLMKAFTTKDYGDVYTTKVQKFSNSEGSGTLDANGFYLKAADGSAIVYKLQLSFVTKDTIPEVTFSGSNKKNENDYNYTDRTGCGSANYLSVPANVAKSDLKQIGTNKLGDPIYGFADTNNTILKKYYDGYISSYYSADNITADTYAVFLESYPIFFWETPYGQLVKFEIKKYELAAECGKPVIYLYPEKPTKVIVKLYPENGFSYTEPPYKDGWEVLADPGGTLKDLLSGKTYPYLFWEGNGGLYKTPQKGFVVAKGEVHNFLSDKLGKYGLNRKEITDFQEFWEPRMQSSPYYFVTFMGNRTMNALAPLDITPKPDTIIRVLMDFTPLEKPISVKGYDIITPERKGFTVVEWGGVLR